MRLLGVAGLALLVIAFLEIAVLVGVTHLLGGVFWTLLLVLATSALGSVLLRREGGRAWQRFRLAAASGQAPGEQASDGLVGLLAAVLLVLPGFLTDVVGLAMLVPPVRRLARGRVQAYAERHVSPSVAGDLFGPRRVRVRQDTGVRTRGSAGGDTIEGEIIEPR